MRSKTALTKLQTILIIDIIIVASALTGIFYVNSLPKPEIAPADIRLTDFTIDQTEAYVGEPVTIILNITNRGVETGYYLANLLIDDIQARSTAVELLGGETKAVEFSISDLSEGIHSIKIGDLEGEVTIVSMFRLSDLAINRTQAAVGEPIGITVKVTNKVEESGNYTIALRINGTTRDTKTIQLAASGSATVNFGIVEETEGTYVFQIGSLNGTFRITAAAPPAKPAEFILSNLVIDPEVAELGIPVQISVKVTNVGEVSGEYSLSLMVNNTEKEKKTLQLLGGEIATVEFNVTENTKGNYAVRVGNLTGIFSIQGPSTISIDSVFIKPYEVWAGQNVTVTVSATNKGSEPSSLPIKVTIEDEVAETRVVQLPGGANSAVIFNIAAPPLDGTQNSKTYSVDVNGYVGGFMVVKTGYHTLSVETSPWGDADFTVNGEPHTTFYSGLYPEGKYTVDIKLTDPTGRITFQKWEDGSTSHIRTVNLNREMRLTAYFTGGTSCPSLFTWNGTDHVHVSDVSNHGWLGYINYINEDGSIVFWRNNPWDYIKLDKSQMQAADNAYNLTLVQRWNEIFYLDQAYMLVVDHPSDMDVYSTMVEEYLDPNYMGKIYTVSNLTAPVSAVNEKGENVLPQISHIDDVFTPGINGINSPTWDNITWNRLTLNLGDSSNAEEIKLVVRSIVSWGAGEDYVTWLDKFFAQPVPNGTQITPPPYMEVRDAQGNWVRVPEGRQFPLPPDSVARTFVVDLTGLFLTDDYSLRISNFWNVTFDFIAVDTTAQQNITVQRIDPRAYLYQDFESPSVAAGNFTRYGNVTELLLSEDDEFVIGRQGDAVSLQFPISQLAPPEENMERDIFFYVSLWFKDENGNWGFGFGFTVDPLPFSAMSGFPYPPTEDYPYDLHLSYFQEYNTRVVSPP